MATPSTRDAIGRVNRRLMDAFGRRDATTVADSYTHDGELLPPQGETVTGRDAIRGYWRGAVNSMGVAAVSLETVEVEEHGETAYEVGRYTLADSGGKELDRGKYVVIWRREGGEWMLHRDIFNSSVAPPP